MHLIYCRIGAEPVVVLLAVNVPYEHSLSLAEDHWERVVIVRIVPFWGARGGGGMGREAVRRNVLRTATYIGFVEHPTKVNHHYKKGGTFMKSTPTREVEKPMDNAFSLL